MLKNGIPSNYAKNGLSSVCIASNKSTDYWKLKMKPYRVAKFTIKLALVSARAIVKSIHVDSNFLLPREISSR